MRKIKLSITTEGYATKAEVPTSHLTFRETEVSPYDLNRLALKGHAFCHLFYHRGSSVTMSDKTDANFREAWCLFIDVDDAPMSAECFVEKLSIRPSVVYSSYRNGMDGKTKFRMVYFLTEPVTDAEEYRRMERGLMNLIAVEVSPAWCGIDTHTTSPSLYMNGTNLETPMYEPLCPDNKAFQYSKDIFHSKSIFLQAAKLNPQFDKHNANSRCSSERIAEFDGTSAYCDDQYLKDFIGMSHSAFLDKYFGKYPIGFYRSSNLVYNDFLHVYEIPEDGKYAEVVIPWNFETNRPTHYVGHRDGSGNPLCSCHRSNICSRIAALFHTIYGEDMTLEHLMYVMMDYVSTYFKTDDWRPSSARGNWKLKVFRECRYVIGKGIYGYGSNGKEPKDYLVDKSWCRLQGIKPVEWSANVKAMQNMLRIFPYYDFSKTINANLKALKEQGIPCSKPTLCKYIKDKETANRVLSFLGKPLI